MRQRPASLCVVASVVLGAWSAAAQTSPWAGVPVRPIANGATERHGVMPLDLDGRTVEKRVVLRVPAPARWNGTLVLGVHGGMGGQNFDPAGTVIGTDETALDDVVGRHALAGGAAYASVDRDGIGATRPGLALTYAFLDAVRAELARTAGRAPSRTYLVGLSMGGGITRLAAEDPSPRVDGAIIIAGANGDQATRRTRQAAIAAQWPLIDPATHPGLPDTHPDVVAYARVVGTPVAARRLWPYVATSAVRAAQARGPEAVEDSTGRPSIPVLEVVGTWDDLVIGEVRAYRARVQPAARHRLYEVEGVWHMSGDDDGVQSFEYIATHRMRLDPSVARAMAEGPSYLPTVREAFDRLVRWVEGQVAPPASQVVAPGQHLAP